MASHPEYMQNRELSWLEFNRRCLDQGADPSVPLLERLNFVSIFWSNLQEFFMVRVGSLTDLSLVKKRIVDTKSGMTPTEQLNAIYARCYELYSDYEQVYGNLRTELAEAGVRQVSAEDLTEEQRAYLDRYFDNFVMPVLSPQIINSRHPFPHLENGALYVIVRLNADTDVAPAAAEAKVQTGKKKAKASAAEGVTFGLVPMPHQCKRIVKLPGEGFQFMLLEHVIRMHVAQIFDMYPVKHTNIICVTRNADLDTTESSDEVDEDYREHMKRILKKRNRLAPVRLESEHKLSATVSKALLSRLELKPHQVYTTNVPLDMSYTWELASHLPDEKRRGLVNKPFAPQWPAKIDRNRRIIDQALERDFLLSYPFESMDPFVQLVREASTDPNVVSIKITLYRLATISALAEALIRAAEMGKDVTALFELRARFDESNNIEWSQRFEEAGCNVIYGFKDYKVHSKICCITLNTPEGVRNIVQLGTGNYHEKTAKLYTDFSYITSKPAFGRDATKFFQNMALENISDSYRTLLVAPLQIKQRLLTSIDDQIALAQKGEPCGLFFKTNSVTDREIIQKLAQASQAGVPITLFVRGISCIVPGVKGFTENVRVVSIVGRLLEHSRICILGVGEDAEIYLSSADLMTRNMEKRVEIAWPVLDDEIKQEVLHYLDTCLSDTAKLRELKPDGTYTRLGYTIEREKAEAKGKAASVERIDAQATLIQEAYDAFEAVRAAEEAEQPKPTYFEGEFEAVKADEAVPAEPEQAAPETPQDSPAPEKAQEPVHAPETPQSDRESAARTFVKTAGAVGAVGVAAAGKAAGAAAGAAHTAADAIRQQRNARAIEKAQASDSEAAEKTSLAKRLFSFAAGIAKRGRSLGKRK